MLDPAEEPYRQPLENGLVLCSAADEEDIDRVAAFNGAVHGPEVAALTRNLFSHHPSTRDRDLIFVMDESNDQIVSSLCLIPWTWRYENVEMRAGELGIVGTSEGYRHRGLVRAQVDYFKHRLRERCCLLSQIQGIPYFYRQFGYEFALPLEGGLRVEIRQIPAPPDTAFTFRLTAQQDIPVLMRLYDEAVQGLVIHATRNRATWRYLLTHAKETATECERWIVQDANGQAVGYVGVQRYHFGEELTASEVSDLSLEAALAVLHHLKKLAVEREKPGLRLNLPASSSLMQLARSLDAHDLGTYAWQIHVPDLAALLRALTPVLERRLAASPFAGLTREIRLSLYRETLVLHFEEGRLREVTELRFAEGNVILRCPPLQFVPLVLGHRTWEELRSAFPDVSVPPSWRLLIDTLFPTVKSFLYTIY
jgi:predicted N-acetyltransferase YhbS